MFVLIGLAWRNLWRNARRTAITATSIALGDALALLMSGINDGAHAQMLRNAIKLGDGHLAVQPAGYLAAPANHIFLPLGDAVLGLVRGAGLPGRAVPRISLQVLASTASKSLGAQMIGIDPSVDPRMDSLRDTMVEGEPISAADARGLMIGTRLAAKIGASVGSKVVIMAGKSGGDIEAQMGRVRGIYHTGVDELDGFAMFTGLELSRRFLLAEGADPAAGPLTQVSVFLDRHDAWPVAKARLQALGLPTGAVVLDWQEIMPQMVTFLVLDDVGHFIQVGLLLLLVAFGILNTILMSVLERTREFGLPRPIGLGRARLLALVVVETALLAILALLAGWAIGGSLVGYGSVHGIDLSMASGSAVQGRGYYLDAIIYPVLSPLRVLELTALVFGVTFISGIYPAVRASRVSPIRAIQA